MKTLDEFYARKLATNLWTAERYREQFLPQLEEQQLLAYFDSFSKHTRFMLRYDTKCMEGSLQPFDWVVGGAWPGGFAIVDIRDCSDRVRSLQDEVARRAREVRCGEYAIPRRLHAGLTFPIEDEQLPAVLAQMTSREHATWRENASRVYVVDYPTQEAPICVRLTGIDDGVEAGFFRTMLEAEDVLRDIARHGNSQEARKQWGFTHTD